VSLGNLLVGGGLSAVLVALIGAIFGRRMKQADYTKALVETANDITERADHRAQRLEEKVERLESHIDELDDRIVVLSELLRAAVPLLQAAGYDAIAAEMRAALIRR
jgi:predicted  nucleic acid-binding Zn-ribbon protein